MPARGATNPAGADGVWLNKARATSASPALQHFAECWKVKVLLAFSFIVKIKPWVAYKATGIVTENLYWGNKRGRHRAAVSEYGK
mmetsp:Transcript_52260/g.140661  ORF Transcript_52260/g.140661 Transcript_52260/m.140661 type:complete len:85 (+) Transcript_52260:379-633(+)